MHEKRTYRNLTHADSLVSFNVIVRETDLAVLADKDLSDITRDLVLNHRGYIETYINDFPEFAKAVTPWRLAGPAPEIIRDMADAGTSAGVGPMASVAGALAEHVGRGLMPRSKEIIVENGGDLFLKTDSPVTAAIYAGESPLSMRIGIRIDREGRPAAMCTSSGTIGHSLSFGKADAVCVVSESCPLADAAATSIANIVKTADDIQKAIDFGKDIKKVDGIVIIIDDRIGFWGNIEIIQLNGKKS